MTELMQEAPKRKRRTKSEIEAARAAGEAVKQVKKVEEKPIETKKLPVEQSVLIMACLEPGVANKAIEAANEKGLEVVILEDRVIHDYLSARNNSEGKKDLSSFLNDTSNRLHAEEQCVKLWMILTGGKPIDESESRVFTEKEVVDKTNLTHSKSKQLFQLLRAFGMLEFVKGTYEFILHFNKKRCHQTIQTEIVAMCKAVNNDILRYKSSIEADKDLTEAQKEDLYKNIRAVVNSSIEF